MKFNKLIISIIALLLLSCCSYPRRRADSSSKRNGQTTQTSHSRTNSNSKSVVKMLNEHGVYYVPCKINGVEMKFIFDTGASDITMSLTEAIFLYKQGKLTDDDFVGTQQYQIADGSIHEGMIVRLSKVEVGDRELTDVRASIVGNMDAPLLLGQSALSKFGKISIDYKRNEIIFE